MNEMWWLIFFTGGINEIVTAFQPRLSPRNHILNGIKTLDR